MQSNWSAATRRPTSTHHSACPSSRVNQKSIISHFCRMIMSSVENFTNCEKLSGGEKGKVKNKTNPNGCHHQMGARERKKKGWRHPVHNIDFNTRVEKEEEEEEVEGATRLQQFWACWNNICCLFVLRAEDARENKSSLSLSTVSPFIFGSLILLKKKKDLPNGYGVSR